MEPVKNSELRNVGETCSDISDILELFNWPRKLQNCKVLVIPILTNISDDCSNEFCLFFSIVLFRNLLIHSFSGIIITFVFFFFWTEHIVKQFFPYKLNVFTLHSLNSLK